MTRSIGIVVADDHPMFRDGVIRTLQAQDDLDVLGEAETADGAVQRVIDCRPDIALLDISMPGNGIDAARKIAELSFAPRIIMLTVSEKDDDVVDAMKAGASGYLLKGARAEELVSVIRSVHAGQSYIPPTLAAQVLLAMKEPKEKQFTDDELIEALSVRETQILEYVAQGKSNKEIARALDLQEKTIKHHMTSILQKMHARNRVEAAIRAREVWGPLP